MSSTPPPPSVSAGWLDDPDDPETSLRYWDGMQWTEQRVLKPAADENAAGGVDASTRTASPGWYPAPDDPSRLRYWDGSVWTTDYAASSTPPPAGDVALPSARPPTDGMAVTSLVFGILTYVFIPFILAIPAVVLGLMSRKRAQSEGRKPSAMATAGLVLGAIQLVLIVFVIAIWAIGAVAGWWEE